MVLKIPAVGKLQEDLLAFAEHPPDLQTFDRFRERLQMLSGRLAVGYQLSPKLLVEPFGDWLYLRAFRHNSMTRYNSKHQ
jgi:hypothetical protein